MKGKKERLEYSETAKKIVEKLSLKEKVNLMSGNLLDVNETGREGLFRFLAEMGTEDKHYNVVPYPAGGLDNQVPPMLFCDGPRGVVCGNGETTCFPVSMARGATFDVELEEAIGDAIGKEVRAAGGNLFAGVCINLPYHPGWGRSQETYGEESYHLGQMGSALVKGVQEQDVMACVKHFAFNQMENARFKVSVTCDQRTEKEVFLPHFQDCIEAGAASVMSSYNSYNSVCCGHHRYLLGEVLKKEWGFDGFVMSDFIFGVKDTIEAANGGQDMEMPFTMKYGRNLVRAVQDGFVPEAQIDDAVFRIVRTILAYEDGHKSYGKEVLACKEHIALARRAAEESITLLKNNKVLPFDKGKIKKIALIGKLAAETNLGDHGSSQVRPPYAVTIKQGLKNVGNGLEVLYCDGSDIGQARACAKKADAAVFVAGYDFDDEGEFVAPTDKANYLGARGGDRKELLGLHEEDVALIREVSPINENSVVILIGGNMILMQEWFDIPGAILMAYYPGMEGGNAIADILFGTVNPSGKLPFAVPDKAANLPYVDWEGEQQYYEYYHGYARLEKNGILPLIPYGFGLSYTRYAYSDIRAEHKREQLLVYGKVKNTGSRKGTEVVQMYVGFEHSEVDRPRKLLRGFCRVELEPQEEKVVCISCPIAKLKYYEPVKREWILEHMQYQIYLGASCDFADLICTEITL